MSSGFQRYLLKVFKGCVISIQRGRRKFEKLVLKQFREVDLKKHYGQHISDKKKGIHKMPRYDLTLSYQFFVPDEKTLLFVHLSISGYLVFLKWPFQDDPIFGMSCVGVYWQG